MVSDLVYDGLANLALHSFRALARPADGFLEDRDPIRHAPRVPASLCQRDTLIEPIEVPRRTEVINLDDHVLHGRQELVRDVIEGVRDKLFEFLAGQRDHVVIMPKTDLGGIPLSRCLDETYDTATEGTTEGAAASDCLS